jgi:hypothetical protein
MIASSLMSRGLRPRCFRRCRHPCDVDRFARLDVIKRSLRNPGEFSAVMVAPSRAFNLRHRSVQTDDHAAHPNTIRRSSRRNVCYQLERNRARRADGCHDGSKLDCLSLPE